MNYKTDVEISNLEIHNVIKAYNLNE